MDTDFYTHQVGVGHAVRAHALQKGQCLKTTKGDHSARAHPFSASWVFPCCGLWELCGKQLAVHHRAQPAVEAPTQHWGLSRVPSTHGKETSYNPTEGAR